METRLRSANCSLGQNTLRAIHRSTWRIFLARPTIRISLGILTGDSLFVSSAGRPDLLGAEHTEQLAAQQFNTLQDFYLKLPDHVMIYPNHGAGSPCGADIGDRLSSTIGYERKFNRFLQFEDVCAFTDYAIKTAPPVPHYYPVMKRLNAKGPDVLGNLPRVPGLAPKAFKKAMEEKTGVLVDTRSMFAFGGGHIPGRFEYRRISDPFHLGRLDAFA